VATCQGIHLGIASPGQAYAYFGLAEDAFRCSEKILSPATLLMNQT